MPFGGATGGSVNIIPLAFLVVNKNEVKVLHLENNTHLIEKVVDEFPNLIDKIKTFFSNNVNDNEVVIDKTIKI